LNFNNEGREDHEEARPLRSSCSSWFKIRESIVRVARLTIVSVLVATSPMAATAQPSFEVASVRQNTSASRVSRSDYKGETFTFTNGSLTDLVSLAYGMFNAPGFRRFQVIEGIPKWGEDRYDIVAKTAGQFPSPSRSLVGSKIGPVNLMLQSLLVERFNLSAHWKRGNAPARLARDHMWHSVVPQAGSTTGDRTAHKHSAYIGAGRILGVQRRSADRRSDRVSRKFRYRADPLA